MSRPARLKPVIGVLANRVGFARKVLGVKAFFVPGKSPACQTRASSTECAKNLEHQVRRKGR
jgi:hypothetical protein